MDGVIPVRARYAVVEACDIKGRSERFVVAYRTEKSLRETIAARRIIATGFSTANQAAGKLNFQGWRDRFAEIVAKRWASIQELSTLALAHAFRAWGWHWASSLITLRADT
jgi:hypothetical protein